MPLPQLSDEQRRAALEKAAEIRKARSELKEQLKTGHMTLTKVLDRAETDVMVGKLKVTELLKSMPGIGKVKAMQIMDRLKGHDWTPYDRSIDNLVVRLRRKVEPDPERPTLIKTVRGVGYTLTADVKGQVETDFR